MLLTTKDAAAYLNIKPETLTKWRWAGTGPKYYRVGGAVRYDKNDVDAFLRGEVKP
ncbi:MULTISPECIES: helix-turn-helix domain-containing protein [unclassified Sphingomonas]|uniref:helix-turn-helix domain-containing protein n=1 Tax=unclassified Sphingomonas TaxID=196159 RepID=UPI0009E9DAE6|nr:MULTISPECIES: helix-turn-helix domain-containing protein [unclassified Sphingomonas]